MTRKRSNGIIEPSSRGPYFRIMCSELSCGLVVFFIIRVRLVREMEPKVTLEPKIRAVSASEFVSPKLKLKRARVHLASLAALTVSVPDDYYRVCVERLPDALGNLMSDASTHPYGFFYVPQTRISDEVSLILGDVVHNLRSSLDHLATNVVRCREPEAKDYFPIPIPAPEKRDRDVVDKLEIGLPGFRSFWEAECDSVRRGGDTFWAIGKLDNDDKHNLIIPSVAGVDLTGFNVILGGVRIDNPTFGSNADFKRRLICSESQIRVEGKPNLSVEAHFTGAGPFTGKDVMGVLGDATNFIEGTIARLEALVPT